MKNPYINASVIAIISIFYAAVFIITSGHIEFQNKLNHSQTLNSTFWNSWSAFLQQGNLKYGAVAPDCKALIRHAFLQKKRKTIPQESETVSRFFTLKGTKTDGQIKSL